MAIAGVNKLTKEQTTGTSITTASALTPVVNRLYLATVEHYDGGVVPPVPTVSGGGGLTWVQVATVLSGDNVRTTLFRALKPSGLTSGTVTADFGGDSQSDAVLIVDEFSGVNTGGANGADAIVQSVTNSGGPGTSSSATLAAFADATNNAAFQAVMHQQSASGTTPEAGWTELADVSTNRAVATAYRVGEDTSPTVSWTGSYKWNVVAAEIAKAPLNVALAILTETDTPQPIVVDKVGLFTSLGPALPEVQIEIDFANNPTSTTRTWLDVTAYVREFSTQRGRADALARPDVGSLTLMLQNDDGRFDPTNTAGAYYPNVLPMRRIRVRCRWNSVIYNIFHGFIEDWPLSFPDLNKNAVVQVRAIDGLGILSQFELVGKSYAAQSSDARSSAVLTDCGISSSEMSFQTGQSSVVASGTLTGTTAQAHLLDVAASENGILFTDRGGTWQFHDRHFRLLSKSASSGTVGTGGGMIGYREIATTYGAPDVWNIVSVTASGGTAEIATDASSTASYYQRTLPWPTGGNYLVASQGEAVAAASYVLSLYKQPALRIPEVVTVPAGATANWSTILGRDISDRLTVSHVRPDGGTILADKFLEGMGHSVTVERDWTMTLRLSDAVSQSYWVLGDAELSLLGETTSLIY